MSYKLGSRLLGRNINNLRYADDTTLMAESEEQLKSLLMRVKEESEKADIKLNIQKTKIITSGPITSWQIEGEKVETVTDFIFLGSKITVCITTNCGKFSKRWEYQTTLPLYWETCMQVKKQQLELDWFQIGKGVQ